MQNIAEIRINQLDNGNYEIYETIGDESYTAESWLGVREQLLRLLNTIGNELSAGTDEG